MSITVAWPSRSLTNFFLGGTMNNFNDTSVVPGTTDNYQGKALKGRTPVASSSVVMVVAGGTGSRYKLSLAR